MRAAQLVAPRLIEVREIPMAPEPGPGEVLIRIRAVTLCGSDLHWYRDGGCGPSRARFPHQLGHEASGDIAALGAGVEGLTVGERVLLEPAVTCGHCEFCLAGKHNLCTTVRMAGTLAMPGFFKEYTVMPAHNAVPMPEGMNYIEAALVEPLAIIIHILELVPVRLGDTVAVTGAGAIGLMTAIAARLAGASKVFVTDRLPYRVEMAREMGADCAVDIAQFRDAVLDQTGGRGADVVFEATGVEQAINESIRVARAGAQVALIGIPEIPAVGIDYHRAMAKELDLQVIRRSNRNAEAAIKMFSRGLVDDRMVTHRMPLEQAPLAFEINSAYADNAGKVAIEI
jgi:L-iditol 2-dehydrogenase